MEKYIISLGAVNGDSVQIAVHRKEDIPSWLEKIDHEGSSVSIVSHWFDGDIIMETRDITEEFIK